MTGNADKTKPSDACGSAWDGPILLQRKLRGDCAKWRTVAAVNSKDVLRAMQAASILSELDRTITWRCMPAPKER